MQTRRNFLPLCPVSASVIETIYSRVKVCLRPWCLPQTTIHWQNSKLERQERYCSRLITPTLQLFDKLMPQLLSNFFLLQLFLRELCLHNHKTFDQHLDLVSLLLCFLLKATEPLCRVRISDHLDNLFRYSHQLLYFTLSTLLSYL